MIIQNQKDLEKFCAAAGAHPFITVDTEFLREKTYYPKLCLIQIGMPDGQAAVIDPLMEGIDLAPVFEVLKNERVLKVFHAARQDLEIFYALMGTVVRPIFDTQIAAMVCGYGNSVGYDNLISDLLGIQLDKSSQYTNWANRPLSERQIDYALGDVTHLVHAYGKLFQKLDSLARTSWVFEEEEQLTNPDCFVSDPEKAWERIKVNSPKSKNLAVLRAIAAWRERKAQDKDIPRAWVLRDETLADMAAQMPKNKAALAKIRNMPTGMVDSYNGDDILKLIQAALDSDPATWPPVVRKKKVSPKITVMADILKLLLKIQCAQHDVAAKLVADSDELEAIAAGNDDVPAMKGWRYEIFGQFAERMRRGELLVGMDNGEIVVVDKKSSK